MYSSFTYYLLLQVLEDLWLWRRVPGVWKVSFLLVTYSDYCYAASCIKRIAVLALESTCSMKTIYLISVIYAPAIVIYLFLVFGYTGTFSCYPLGFIYRIEIVERKVL